MPWVRLSKWRDIRAREERVEALLEQWNSDVSAARSDPCSFSSAFEVLASCEGELHEALDGRSDDDGGTWTEKAARVIDRLESCAPALRCP